MLEHQSTNEDTLGRVAISQSAIDRWHQMMRKLDVATVRQHGITSSDAIPDEMARVEADGSLTIYVPMPDGAELSIRVEPHEWAWSGPQNQ